MSLVDWEQKGWLTAHSTSPKEIERLLALVERDLAASETEGLGPDWRLNIAYNAALQSATVALAAAGYRASREQHHYRVIQSLRETIRADARTVGRLEAFRTKRHMTGYERVGLVSDAEAAEMRAMAAEIRDAVRIWLRRYHRHLLPRR